MSVIRGIAALLATAVTAAMPGPVAAQTALSFCSVQAEPIEFAQYDVFDAQPTRSTTQIRLHCNLPVTAAISLSPGASGDFDKRHMIGATGVLTYNLYADSGGSRIAGDGSDGTVLLVQLKRSLSRDQTFSLYGEIDARQMVKPGDYSDIVHVTVEF